ncbi:hypothetical protein SDC9_62704 [bioreactor metagenome]|uniref:Uncharacterized protein n=1 Tax=bioreactor metagenome TaxID=1076179 RepID=A0A644XJF3_9ZZZZ
MDKLDVYDRAQLTAINLNRQLRGKKTVLLGWMKWGDVRIVSEGDICHETSPFFPEGSRTNTRDILCLPHGSRTLSGEDTESLIVNTGHYSRYQITRENVSDVVNAAFSMRTKDDVLRFVSNYGPLHCPEDDGTGFDETYDPEVGGRYPQVVFRDLCEGVGYVLLNAQYLRAVYDLSHSIEQKRPTQFFGRTKDQAFFEHEELRLPAIFLRNGMNDDTLARNILAELLTDMHSRAAYSLEYCALENGQLLPMRTPKDLYSLLVDLVSGYVVRSPGVERIRRCPECGMFGLEEDLRKVKDRTVTPVQADWWHESCYRKILMRRRRAMEAAEQGRSPKIRPGRRKNGIHHPVSE